MSPRHSDNKSTASDKASLKSSVKKPTAWLMMAKKVTPSMKLPTVFQTGSAQKTHVASSKPKSMSTRTSSSKLPPVSHKSSSLRHSLSQSVRSSASRKVTTDERTKSVAKTDAGLKSARLVMSSDNRKFDTTAQLSASTKKQSFAATESVSSAKSGIVAKINGRTEKSLAVREMASSSKESLVSKRKGNRAHHHHHHIVVVPHPVVVVPPPVIIAPRRMVVEPRVACKYCRCNIRDDCVEEARRRCCFDCRTRNCC